MNLSSKILCPAGFLLWAALGALPGSAAPITGTFLADDQTFTFNWTVSQASNLVASTDSYASGGFVPVLSLFDSSTGALIGVDGGDASCTSGRMIDGNTGLCNDAYLSASVAKGSYTIVLSEFDNYPNGSNQSDGFSQTGMGNFTSGACAGASGPFFETDLAPCVQRTGSYSLNLTAAAAPEPATAWLFLPLAALAAYQFRKRARVNKYVTTRVL